MTLAMMDCFTVRDVNIWDRMNIYNLFSNPETVRYMGVARLKTVQEAGELIKRYAESPTRWLAICEGTKFLGIVGLEIRGHQATLTLASNGAHKGLGREFSVPFVQWIFTHPQIWRVWSYCHVDNLQAQRVNVRMGAQCEGRLCRFEFFPNLSDEPQDVYVYSIVR
jgi:RimJ/RimL family protein N-acetyltransferase